MIKPIYHVKCYETRVIRRIVAQRRGALFNLGRFGDFTEVITFGLGFKRQIEFYL